MTTPACGTTCDGTCGWCRLTAERDALKDQMQQCKNSVAETMILFPNVREYVAQLEVERDKLQEELQRVVCKLLGGTLHVASCSANPDTEVGCDGCSCVIGRKLKTLKAAVAQMREALELYGRHDEDCSYPFKPSICDCGLDAALAVKLGKKT